ncbi:MAG: hypothetical protein AB1489_09470 [Acidobacteriota bacterium]
MAALTGLEKFSHLEDKIYRTIELCKNLRQQRDQLEREIETLRQEVHALSEEKQRVNEQLERFLAERDEIRLKVESMLDAIAIIDPEPTETVRR